MKYKIKRDFSNVIMVQGSNVYVVGVKGDTLNLDPDVARLVNHNCAFKVLVEVKKKAGRGKPATAQVTKAHTR